MSLKPLPVLLAFSLFALSPAMPIVDLGDQGAAFAKGGNGNGNSGGTGNSGGNSGGNKGGSGKGAEKKASKSAGGEAAPKKAKPANAGGKAKVAEGELAPNELGKMNGALHASINAVLAHIRNGQLTNGPVALMAGLAVADAAAATAAADLQALQDAAAPFAELDAAVLAAGFDSVEAYLEAKNAGTLTEEQLALAGEIDLMIEGVGGLNEDGTGLAESGPSEDELLAAEEAAAAAALGVTDAETAIGDAWNKDGDLGALLVLLREKLAANGEVIAATLAEIAAEEAAAAEEVPVEGEEVPPVEGGEEPPVE